MKLFQAVCVVLGILLGVFSVSNSCAKELRILKPNHRAGAYDVAASEFQRYYELVCGEKLDIVTEPNEEDDYIVIGSDMANRFVRTLIERKVLDDLPLEIDSDEYRILSVQDGERRYLILAGGRPRSTLYADYDFFERRAGCRWFWDGDVVPKADAIDISGLDVCENPRFRYRGIRYFAHRGLFRFQAEHWGFDDWKKEIDWCVKKRLNLFMLRIGQDDLFQKAFPETVSYPDPSKPIPGMGRGYANRNLFWPLEYRGALRKRILDYAFERDLMHPEDFGTMTHWYSATPQEFLDQIKPEFTPQVSGYSLPTEQVWDIRFDHNLDNYWKLTQASIDHYGKPEIFHTIGFAERMVYKERTDNVKMKIYFYRRMLENLRAHYPNAPVLLAGWDFYGWWKEEEIQSLLSLLDPEKTLILDYSLDLEDDAMTGGNNLTHWGMVGKFPYITGIFLAYESALDIRGRYGRFQEHQKQVFSDPYCKGLVLWPESSHTDIFMLHYFTSNAWKPGESTPEALLTEFCHDRYAAQAEAFEQAWNGTIPPSQMLSAAWNFWANFVHSNASWDATDIWKTNFESQRDTLQNAPMVLEKIKSLAWSDEFARRDSIDLARTLADRLLTCARIRMFYDLNLWREGKADANQARQSIDAVELLAEAFVDLLALHDDYSLYRTYQKTDAIEPIQNPDFGKVLIDNASCSYCMSHQYELAAYWYLPTFRFMADWGRGCLDTGQKETFAAGRAEMIKRRGELLTQTQATPLAEMAPSDPQTHERFTDVVTRLEEAAKIIVR